MAYDFDKIARDYDRLNRIMTLGLDRRWRRHAVHQLSSPRCPLSALDVACGTGDMMVELVRQGCTVTGVDLSQEMLSIARHKLAHSSVSRFAAASSPNLGEQLNTTHSNSPSKLEGVPAGRGRVSSATAEASEFLDDQMHISNSPSKLEGVPAGRGRVSSATAGAGELPDDQMHLSNSPSKLEGVPALRGRMSSATAGGGEFPDDPMHISNSPSKLEGVPAGRGRVSIAMPGAVSFQLANAEHLPFPDATFDAVTCAFGIRNFVHLEQGLREMLRVLKPGGRLLLLEMATPDSPLVRPLYHLYARRIIPLLGHLLAGNRQAYTYLPASIERFPKGSALTAILQRCGFDHITHHKYTFGVCRRYMAVKQ